MRDLEHHYGSQVHILNSPCLNLWLGRLSRPDTFQPAITNLVEHLYTHLLQEVIDREFTAQSVLWPTRMSEKHPDAPLQLDVVDSQQRVVSVALARAGTWPSHVCYTLFNQILDPSLVRQDHILASRWTNEKGEVQGTKITGAKIGGDVENSLVLLPDPMGATGHTICHAIGHYKESIPGTARRYLTLHLIVTPEYLKMVTETHPDVQIYALRLDRGLSSPRALQANPGRFWDEEKGLNEEDYIVPGAGGLGEIMNNSFV